MTNDSDQSVALEFSRVISLEGLPRGGKHFSLRADESECVRIAKRLGAPAVHYLRGEIRLRADKRSIHIEGSLKAALVRECVASLEELDEEIDEAFQLEFTRIDDAQGDAGQATGEDVLDWEAPDYHTGEQIDLGEVLVQQLSLAMDPFPRKEGTVSLAEQYGREDESSPFSILRTDWDKS